ncbi:DUF4333 domain-containing protein [Mycobacterium vicinigordonae]|uniref:DUF4333 domain-containing protein n=1 Tax=Mycobacterium vicinigordonae TaxID=1719132 RepID=A0A7D6E1S5_9MYCO|nr:DUF4333 domain-containing protein [Mycobacterium vicinigordonae]QLL09069.1 DUF4333 domain-containing protein [Mycobacterium vicinigordonae]
MSTPRDRIQPPWPPNRGPDPSQEPTQHAEIPWYKQPVVRPAPPQSPPRPPSPYPGQYGSPPQYPPPGPGGPPPATPTLPQKPRSSNRTPLLVGAAIVAVVIAGVIAVLLLAGVVNGDTKKIAVSGVQTEVEQILLDRTSGYYSDDIKNVRCNNGQDPTVKKGQKFSCDVTVRGKPHQLTVTFDDDNGTYTVGLPQLGGGK